MKILLSGGALLLIGWLVMFLWTDNTPAQEALLLAPIQRGNIENFISATGKLEPTHYVEVGAQVSGQVEKMYVTAGDRVKAGQLVAEIDATVFKTKVANAEASLESQQAQLQQLQAELSLAQLRAKRNQNLYQKEAISEDTLFESLANEKILEAKVRATKAGIRADKAILDGDKATLGYAKIYAPLDGTVVDVYVREGQTINANQNAPLLLKIANLKTLTLRADVSEADISRIEPGMEVYFQTFGSDKRKWYSTVRLLLPTPSIVNDVVLYQVLIDVDNQDGRLMDAMTTQVFFIQDKAENTLLVPLGALHKTPKGYRVAVQVENEIEHVKVAIGVKNKTHAEVRSGLSEQDVVVVGNQARQTQTATSALGSAPRGRRGY